MIGVSKDPTKVSTIVMKYMQKYGYKVIPVNPRAKGEKILGEDVYEKITDIKEPVDIVDVFRPSKEAFPIAEDALKIEAKVLWLQLGIRDENAKKLMEVEGLASVHLDYVRYPDVILGDDLQPKYNIVQDTELPEYDYDYHPIAIEKFEEIFNKNPLKNY